MEHRCNEFLVNGPVQSTEASATRAFLPVDTCYIPAYATPTVLVPMIPWCLWYNCIPGAYFVYFFLVISSHKFSHPIPANLLPSSVFRFPIFYTIHGCLHLYAYPLLSTFKSSQGEKFLLEGIGNPRGENARITIK